MIGSTYVCSTSFVLTSFTVAVFAIVSLLFKSFTFTVNSIVFVSPASNSTSIPLLKVSKVYSSSEPSTTILPSTKLVPSGASSTTFAIVGAVPSLLSNVIVYVISSFSFTSAPACGSADFVNLRSALFTTFNVSFVSIPSTVALFLISFVNNPSANSSTVTSKVTVVIDCLSTFTVIPDSKLDSVYSVSSSFTLILPSTKLVPSGTASIITTSFSSKPVFSTEIV